jgi:hypothetical protein
MWMFLLGTLFGGFVAIVVMSILFISKDQCIRRLDD